MSFVGYDPHALSTLATRLWRAHEELAHLARSPTLIDHPQRRLHIHQTLAVIDHWAHRTRAIATCDIMERQHHVHLAPAPPAAVPWREATLHHWFDQGLTVVRLDLGPALPLDEAFAAAAMSMGGPRPRHPDHGDITWLVDMITNADALPLTADLVTLLHQMARPLLRSHLPVDTSTAPYQSWSMLVQALAHHPDEFAALLVTLEPTTASLMLAASPLAGSVRGHAAADLFDRWATGPWWLTGRQTTHNAADYLLGAVLDDVDALATLWERRRSEPGVMLYGPNDVERVRRAITALAHPDLIGSHEAATHVLPLLRYIQQVPHTTAPDLAGLRQRGPDDVGLGSWNEVRWWHLRQAVTDSVAPWMMSLTTDDPRWSVSSAHALSIMRWLMATPDGAEVIASSLGVALTTRTADLDDDPVARRHAIERMAWTIGVVDALIDDTDPRYHDDMVRHLVALSIGHVAGVVAVAATAVVAPALGGVVRAVTAGQVMTSLGGSRDGPTPSSNRSSVHRQATAAAALMAVIVADHRQRNWISPQVPPPPPASETEDAGAPDLLAWWLIDLDQWGDEDVTPLARRELHQVWHAVVPAERRAAVDRGRFDITD